MFRFTNPYKTGSVASRRFQAGGANPRVSGSTSGPTVVACGAKPDAGIVGRALHGHIPRRGWSAAGSSRPNAAGHWRRLPRQASRTAGRGQEWDVNTWEAPKHTALDLMGPPETVAAASAASHSGSGLGRTMGLCCRTSWNGSNKFGPRASSLRCSQGNAGPLPSFLDPLGGPDAKRQVWGRSILHCGGTAWGCAHSGAALGA
jgi:hypothetical protein